MKLKEKLAKEFAKKTWDESPGRIVPASVAFLRGFEKALKIVQDYYNDNLDSEYIDFEKLGEEEVNG